LPTAEYCREIEAYLCRKNDGHLVRVVGPSFDLVSSWAAQGVPLKIAFKGIDRYFERYYRKGPRRRPVRIDFCEHDVMDVFDEWRRATGVVAPAAGEVTVDAAARPRRSSSLPVHLERVVVRLTTARATGAVDGAFDELIDRVSRELDVARADPRGVRGDARQALVDRLALLDHELLFTARRALDETAEAALAREAEEELAGFRSAMAAEVFARARDRAIDRLVRERFGLPTVAFSGH
jgi:hypothetical protein